MGERYPLDAWRQARVHCGHFNRKQLQVFRTRAQSFKLAQSSFAWLASWRMASNQRGKRSSVRHSLFAIRHSPFAIRHIAIPHSH